MVYTIQNKKSAQEVEAVTPYDEMECDQGSLATGEVKLDDVSLENEDDVSEEVLLSLLDKSIAATRKTYARTLVEMHDAMNNEGEQQRYDELHAKTLKLREQLKEMKEEREQTGKKNQDEKVVIPRNIPLLQLPGDVDVQEGNIVHENIDRFLTTFEMIVVNQNGLDLEKHWEACLINAVMHSNDKTTWYQQSIMGKKFSWSEAKQMVIRKYKGERMEAVYLQQLMSMTPRTGEEPVDFIDRFRMRMRDAVVPDSVTYGNILLQIMDDCYGDFSDKIRLSNASTGSEVRPPMNVAFLAEVAPILCVGKQGVLGYGGLMNSKYATPTKMNGRGYPAEGSRDAGRRNSQRRHFGHNSHGHEAGGRIRPAPRRQDKNQTFKKRDYSGESEEKQRCRRESLCFHCKSKWAPGHKCQEYVDHRNQHNREFKMRMARRKEKAPVQEEVPMEASPSDDECSTAEGRLAYRARIKEEVERKLREEVVEDLVALDGSVDWNAMEIDRKDNMQ